MTTHNDESLKPCPFCAAQPKEFAVGRLYCPTYDCPAGRNVTTPEAWNRRTEQPQPAPMQVDRPPPLPPDDMHGLNQRGLYTAEQMHEYALAALASRAEHAVPEGYVLLPVEPTDDMIANMCAAHEFSQFYDLEGPMKDAYKAMIAAAPSNKEVER